MYHPSFITFSGNPGPPFNLCDGDRGTLSVTVWRGFADDMTIDSLILTLMATYNADEGGNVWFLEQDDARMFVSYVIALYDLVI